MFWTIVNYEVWDIGKPMARQLLPAPTGVPLMPDVVHWGFHEYGMRVGCWRFHELFRKLGIKPTLAANARICEDYPRVAAAGARRRLGVHGPRLRAGPDPQGGRPGRHDQPHHGHHGEISPASGRSAGSAPASRRRWRRPTCWRRPASNISATGSMTTSRRRSAPRTGRWSPCPTPSSATTSR